MKKYLLAILFFVTTWCFAQPSAGINQSNTDNNLVIQLVDSKLVNLDNKVAAVAQSNQDGIADLKARTDEKLADKFKQLDDRAGDINFWLAFLGVIIAIATFVVTAIQIVSAFGLVSLRKEADKLLTEMRGFHRNAEISASEIGSLAKKVEHGGLTPEEAQKLKNDSNDLKNIPESQLTANDWFIRGLNAQEQNEFYEAITYYNSAIKLNCSNKLSASAYNNRGNAKFMLRLYIEAGVDYSKAIELSPFNQYCYNNRGIISHELKDYNGAIKDYDKAIELDPKYVEAYFNKSCSYALMKNKDEALNWLDKALQLDYSVSDVLKENDWGNYSNDQDFENLISKYTKQ